MTTNRFKTLSFSGVKNAQQVSLTLGSLTVFCGPNRAGKSAAMEASRLAATGTAMIGKSVEKQKLLLSGVATADIDGDATGAWSMKKKREWALDCEGMRVASVHGDTPLTVKEFWDLSGEERWGLIESCVGKFELEQPADAKDLKEELRKLYSTEAPAKYEGEPKQVLQEKLAAVDAFLNEQAENRKHIAYRKQRLDQDIARRDQLSKQQVELSGKISNAESGLLGWLLQSAKARSLSDELHSVNHELLKYGTTINAATQGILSEFRSELERVEAISPSPQLDALMDSIDLGLPAREPDVGLLNEDTAELEALLSNMGVKVSMKLDGSLKYSDGDSVIEAINTRNAELESNIATLRKQLTDTRAEIASRTKEIEAESEHVTKVVEPEVIGEKTAERELIISSIADADTWLAWVSGAKKRQEQMDAIQAQINDIEKLELTYAEARSEYLKRASVLVKTMADFMLSTMGLPPLEIDINLRGKRGVLSITSGGVDIAAMAGSEAVIYGAAVLFAIAQNSQAKIPLLWIEAAEMDQAMLDKFCAAIVAAFKIPGTRGNVFLAHWCRPSAEILFESQTEVWYFGGDGSCVEQGVV